MIHHVTTYQFSLPMPRGREVKTALHTISGAEIVLVEIGDHDGRTGMGYAMSFRRNQTAAVRLMIHDLATFLADGEHPREQRRALLEQLDFTGKAGIGMAALSAIDTALWDLNARILDLPLSTMLGATRTSVPLYTAGGWLSYSSDDLVAEAVQYRDQGFMNHKIKVGHPNGWREDLRRVAQVREAVGDAVAIFVDANQSWNRIDALTVGRGLEDLGVTWFEEPVAAEDVTGSAELARLLDLPVVVGQSAHLSELRSFIEARAGDILMPDFMRCGGITGWMETAALAAANHLPVTSHAFTEICVHLACAAPNTVIAEYIPRWFDSMYDGPPTVRDGRMFVDDRPGLGLSVSTAMKATSIGGVHVITR